MGYMVKKSTFPTGNDSLARDIPMSEPAQHK
jgi:hypothetical protein